MRALWILWFVLGGDPLVPETSDAPAATVAGPVQPDELTHERQISGGHPWHKCETENFVVWAPSAPAETRRLATLCERLRRDLQEVWLDQQSAAPWTPRCEIVVHTTVQQYVAALGPGSEATSGCSTLRLSNGKVTVRRIDVRLDATHWLRESLPHELTHVVLADRFSSRRIPRWADEGMAMLAESSAKAAQRVKDFEAARAAGQQFQVRDLLQLTGHPPGNRRRAFSGQSLLLTRYLIELGSPADFVRFVEQSQTQGYDKALRDVYQIASVEQLQTQWRPRFAQVNDAPAGQPIHLLARIYGLDAADVQVD